MLVAIAEVVLAELARRVALRLHDVRDRRHPFGDAMRITRHADRQETGAKRLLTENERRAPGGAALLTVGIREYRAFICDAIDVRGLISHEATRVGADLRDADVVTKNDEDVRLLRRHSKLLFLNGHGGLPDVRPCRSKPSMRHWAYRHRLCGA